MKSLPVAIVGAGPYGLSVAAHLAMRGIEHRILGRPMHFWTGVAQAGERRFLKSYCFGTDISTPKPGFRFADYSRPRGLETFEPCSMGDFAAYGRWFQENNVPWAEPVEVVNVRRRERHFEIRLSSEEEFVASQLIVATGLDYYAHIPSAVKPLVPALTTHTSGVTSFAAFKGMSVAIIGAGQSALEAAALLNEAGAQPVLLVRDQKINWHFRVSQDRTLWRRLRSPISKLGTGPKAWALTRFPGAVHRWPIGLRTRFVKNHLPAEGAWWLRERVVNVVPTRLETSVTSSEPSGGRALLHLHSPSVGKQSLAVDHVIAGSGYIVDVDRLTFLDELLRHSVVRIESAPRLSGTFESSVPGLRFIGPASAMSFGPLYRFVVGADYTARIVSACIAAEVARAA